MPSKTKKQQRFFFAVKGCEEGGKCSAATKKVSDEMSGDEIEKFTHMKKKKKKVKESNIDKCLFVIAEEVPNTSGIRDALDKVITGDEDLTDRERLTLLKYKLIGDNGKPTQLAREEFSELFESKDDLKLQLSGFQCPKCKSKLDLKQQAGNLMKVCKECDYKMSAN